MRISSFSIQFLLVRFVIITSLLISLQGINNGVAHAETSVQFSSGLTQTTLIELYTSEGCSSCPPSERFLNKFRDNKQLWKNIIPVAFHVDYWDYIGWKDPFAQAYFGQRQSTYARQKNLTTVYTPAFVVNGQSWRKGLFNNKLPVSNSTTGLLKANITKNQLIAEYQEDTTQPQPLVLNIAILGMDIDTHILAGENAGQQSHHEFVVVGFKQIKSDTAYWETRLPSLHYPKAKSYALAIWVNKEGNIKPLQATGGNLPLSFVIK